MSRVSLFFQEEPKYTKRILKKGDKTNFPKKGDVVSCFYTGKLPNGDVFDSNVASGNSSFLPLMCSINFYRPSQFSVNSVANSSFSVRLNSQSREAQSFVEMKF